VTLLAGPTALPDPVGLTTVHVEDARAMERALAAHAWGGRRGGHGGGDR
jgi:phosphopantothenoylcysteine synthetase/decarboxylase